MPAPPTPIGSISIEKPHYAYVAIHNGNEWRALDVKDLNNIEVFVPEIELATLCVHPSSKGGEFHRYHHHKIDLSASLSNEDLIHLKFLNCAQRALSYDKTITIMSDTSGVEFIGVEISGLSLVTAYPIENSGSRTIKISDDAKHLMSSH